MERERETTSRVLPSFGNEKSAGAGGDHCGCWFAAALPSLPARRRSQLAAVRAGGPLVNASDSDPVTRKSICSKRHL